MIALLEKTRKSFFSRSILTMAGGAALAAIASFALLLGGVVWALRATSILAPGWMENAIDIVLGAGSFILAWFLFPATMVLIASFFAETVIERIERNEYGIQEFKERPLWQEIRAGAGFALRAIGLNLICLPLYFIPIVNVITYYLVNATLIGREFFDMVTVRHLDDAGGKALYLAKRGKIMCAGFLVVLAGTIPVLNLFSPIIGVILMTHLYQSIKTDAASSRLLHAETSDVNF